MSTSRQWWQALGMVAAASVASAAWDASAAWGAEGTARLATFDKADGGAFFALSVMPKVAADPRQTNEVVILFDTSASQAGTFRTDAVAALGSLLQGLNPADRVKLVAVDAKAIPLTNGFVAPGSPEMQTGLARLQQRTPLGATDMSLALSAAAASYAGPPKAARSVIYLGDGMSKAQMFTVPSFSKSVEELVNGRISVSSYVIGQERNVHLMAALANQTGGVVMIDSDMPNAASQAGQVLAGAVGAGVIWPTSVTLPTSVAKSYPATMPPLRTDRDSILIGELASADAGDVAINGEMNGQPVAFNLPVAPEKSNEDFAFLPKLVDQASADGGVTLPTVGSAGLREAAAITQTSAIQLAKLGHEALSSGNFGGAKSAAQAALARDPKNPQALAILSAAKKGPGVALASATEPDLKLTSFADPAANPAPGSLLEEVLAEPGFIGDVQRQREVVSGKIRAEVENGLNQARTLMGQSPDTAEQDLKLLMENVERSPDLDPEVRSQLREQIEDAIRQARREKSLVDERKAQAEEQKAAAIELERLNLELLLKEQRLKQIMDRFDSLMEEGRYRVANDEVGPEVQNLAPNSPIANAVRHGGGIQMAYFEMREIFLRRQKGYLDTLYQVELSQIPFPDEPPIVYPSAEKWEDLSLRRKKYAAVDLARQGGSEERIFAELNRPTVMEFVETPLKDAIDFMANQHGIPIVLNAKKLEEAGVNIDTPVTKNLRGISLRSALRLLLNELELTYVVRDEVLQITTPEDAESQLITKVYPVGDLVLPIGANSNLFGIGGVGGLNGAGGGGGGFGGGFGGGGGGGMGGGMMGGGGGMMGGGGGGGFFAVEDDLSLGSKKPTPSTAQAAPASVEPQVRRPSAGSSKKATRISVTAGEGQSVADAWDHYFGEQQARLAGASDRAPATRELLASVRETVRQLMKEKKNENYENYAEIVSLIHAALRNGFVEPWMYEAMGLALQADLNSSPDDLERALLSAVDFATSEEELMFISSYMAHVGLEKRALSLFRQLGDSNPSRPEPFLQALRLAQKLEDAEATQWACVGLLQQAWTGEHRGISEKAYRIAKSQYESLLAAGRKEEAEALDTAVRQARRRDCVVIVTWTGDADIDVSVEEPSGSTCSIHQPRSTSGGVHMGDVAAGSGITTAKGFSEAYVCGEAFSGEYKVLLRKIWGRPTSGKVSVDVYTNYGTPEQIVMHDQVPVDGKNALVVFNVKDGRRKDALPEAQVANVARVQNAMNRAVLAQQLAGLEDSQASESFAMAQALAQRNGLGRPFFRRGAVGYRPVITALPEGANFNSNAVISADRRYVRVAPSPTFSQVTEVSTFNFVTGQGSGNSGGGGGAFGGPGGGGGFF